MHSYLFSIIPLLYIFIKNQEEVCFLHTFCFAIGILFVVFLSKRLLKFFFEDKNFIDLFLSFFGIVFWIIHPLAYEVSLLFFKLPAFILAYRWFLLIICFLLVLGIIMFFLLKLRKKLKGINRILNVFSFFVFLIILLNLVTNYFSKKEKNVELSIHSLPVFRNQLPNIYHILLDAYANEDTLKNLYGYDNSDFYNELKQEGFVCFPDSRSTYSSTLFSTTSMLNFGEKHEKLTEAHLLRRLKNNKVWKNLKSSGYNIHLFSQTDYYVSKSFIKNDLVVQSWAKSAMIFVQKTPVKHMIENLFLTSFYEQHINEIHQIFGALKEGSKKYSFNNQCFYVHMLNPHEPLVFDENGGVSKQQTFEGFLVQRGGVNDMFNEDFPKRYINQIKAISKLTLDCIEDILSQYPKDNQPIIILHGDHGRCLSAKDPFKYALGNLFALYVPESWREKAKDLTFNNLYRFIFNQLFNANYEYLPPRYFNGKNDVTEEVLKGR